MTKAMVTVEWCNMRGEPVPGRIARELGSQVEAALAERFAAEGAAEKLDLKLRTDNTEQLVVWEAYRGTEYIVPEAVECLAGLEAVQAAGLSVR